MAHQMEKIRVVNLTKIFGPHPERAMILLSQGKSKEEIFNQMGHAVALANVSFSMLADEILVVQRLALNFWITFDHSYPFVQEVA